MMTDACSRQRRKKKVKNNIKKYRDRKLLTQMGLADAIGVSRYSIIEWEKGAMLPYKEQRAALAEFFDVDIANLFPWS